MGLWGADTDWTVAHRLPDIPAEEIPTDSLERQAIAESGDLAYMRKQIEASARMTGLTKASALVPDLSVGPAIKHEASGEWLLGPAFTLPIPLFDQGQARVAKAQAEFRRESERYYQAAVQIRSAVRVGRSRLLAARTRLGRIGFDSVAGFLRDGMQALEFQSELVRRTERITAANLRKQLDSPTPPVVLDVRSEKEWQTDRIEGSLNIPLPHLCQRVGEVPRDKPVVVHCASGYRSSIAVSILAQLGFTKTTDLVGGIAAWHAMSGKETQAPAG